jgi:hypothetical protein
MWVKMRRVTIRAAGGTLVNDIVIPQSCENNTEMYRGTLVNLHPQNRENKAKTIGAQ